MATNCKREGTGRRGITHSALETYKVLVWLAKKGQRAPAIRLLCSIASFARSTICKALRQLQAVGLILRRPRHELQWLRGVLRNAQ
jgi:DNA-binding transcriptional MocR family regulator